MPLSLLAALLMAFGYDSGALPVPVRRSEAVAGVLWVLAGVALIALLSFLLGRLTASRVVRRGYASSKLRRGYYWGSRLIGVLTLAVYGGIIYAGDWPRVVRKGFGLGGIVLVSDVLIILPFLLAQLVSWWGMYPAERVLRPAVASSRAAGLSRYLSLKLRQTLGLLLPVLLVFSLGQDLLRRFAPAKSEGAWAEPVGMAAMGMLVLFASPLFVRLAWPSRPLPPGPLRDRLEHLARRFGFRCTEILVLDTGESVVNAGVTGTLPWFRYVFLTDALVEDLQPNEVAAVFGHEIGHIAHRHLPYFGFFLLGSMGVITLLGRLIEDFVAPGLPSLRIDPSYLKDGLGLLAFGLYFLLVFGHLSRRFERQADVFGCRSVSCGVVDCPPHADLNRFETLGDPSAIALCPVGIRTFASALGNVASLNGMAHGMRSWRHGSIARRIAFLEGLEGKPEAERRFQAGVSRLRLAMAVVLIAVVVIVAAADKIRPFP